MAEAAVGTGKLTDLAVNAGKLAENSVNTTKIVDGQVKAVDVGAAIVRTAVDTGVPTGTTTQETASCVGSERLLGGGGGWSGALAGAATLKASLPVGNTWVAQGTNNSGGNLDFTAYALCLQ